MQKYTALYKILLTIPLGTITTEYKNYLLMDTTSEQCMNYRASSCKAFSKVTVTTQPQRMIFKYM